MAESAMPTGVLVVSGGTRVEMERMEACPLAGGTVHVGGWTTVRGIDPNADSVTIEVHDGPTVTDVHPLYRYLDITAYGRRDGKRFLRFELSQEEGAPLLAHEPLQPHDEWA